MKQSRKQSKVNQHNKHRQMRKIQKKIRKSLMKMMRKTRYFNRKEDLVVLISIKDELMRVEKDKRFGEIKEGRREIDVFFVDERRNQPTRESPPGLTW